MKIVIPGGSGQVGGLLVRAFGADGHEVVVLSRGAKLTMTRTVQWDGNSTGAWAREIDGADVVINLAGRNVNCRYGAANRRAILQSRVDSVRAVGRAIVAARRPPRVWLQASTATIYAHTLGAPNDEATGVIGGDEPDVPDTWRFSIEVAKAWEEAAVDFKLGLPASRWMLELGAAVLRTETELVLKSRRVVPGRLVQSGFSFKFPSWPAAAVDLCRRWRDQRKSRRSA